MRITSTGSLRIRTGFPVMALRPPEGHRDEYNLLQAYEER